MPLADAPTTAKAFDVEQRTLRRWVDRSCPVARAGRPGRGHAALFDVEAVRAWRASAAVKASSPGPELRAFATRVPVILADGLARMFRTGVGAAPFWKAAGFRSPAEAAGLLAFIWHHLAADLEKELRDAAPGLDPREDPPESIRQLVKLANESPVLSRAGTVGASSVDEKEFRD